MDKRLLVGIALIAALVGVVWYGVSLQADAPRLAQADCHVPARAPHLELALLNATRGELSFDLIVRNPTTSDYRFFAPTLEARLYAVTAAGDLEAQRGVSSDIDHVAGFEGDVVPPRGSMRFTSVSLEPGHGGRFVVAVEAGGLCGVGQATIP